jgi:hypothetical protein
MLAVSSSYGQTGQWIGGIVLQTHVIIMPKIYLPPIHKEIMEEECDAELRLHALSVFTSWK